ncbi:MAG: TetR/AcrR family transcriptional regulator [Acidimicrobiales bacterium]
MTESTRARLLDATRRCISAQGLAATTSRDITAAAGANLAAITYHFGAKDDLVAAALLDELRAWLAPTLEVLAGGGDPATRTLTAVQTLVAEFERRRAEAPAYLEAMVQAPRLGALHDGVVTLWSELRRLLVVEMRALVLPSWVDPDAMSALLVAVANGLVLQVTVDPSGPPLDAMAAQFAGLLLAAQG